MKTFLLLLLSNLIFAVPAFADLDCSMSFKIKSWSFIYKQGKGYGTLDCGSAGRVPVSITSHGGGLTVGKSRISGRASFKGVDEIGDVFGSYASGQAHAGAGKSGNAQVMTKGDVSMSLSGSGKGVNIGFAFGSFKISRK